MATTSTLRNPKLTNLQRSHSRSLESLIVEHKSRGWQGIRKEGVASNHFTRAGSWRISREGNGDNAMPYAPATVSAEGKEQACKEVDESLLWGWIEVLFNWQSFCVQLLTLFSCTGTYHHNCCMPL